MADYIVVIVEGSGAGREFDLVGSVILGRDPSVPVSLEDAEASRQHASITAREGGAVVEDLGSTNGTVIAGERISGPVEIGPGDRVQIGTTIIELRVAPPGGAAAPPAAAPDPAAAPAPPGAGAPPAPGPEQPAPPAPPPAGGPPVPYGAPSDYPIAVDGDFQEEIPRWVPLVQWWLLIIPQYIAFFFVAIAALFGLVVAWFAVIITGRWPRGLFDFVAGAGRWGVRLNGYYYLLTERYPPFSLGEEPAYPIRARFDYPEAGIARWRPIVQWILAIPHLIIVYVLQFVALICAIAAGFAILFTGKYPRGLYDIVVGFIRWQTRTYAYYFFMTDRYPPFTLSE